MRDSLFVLLYSDLHGSLIGTPDDGAEVSDAQTVADELDVFMALLLDERRGDIAGGGNHGISTEEPSFAAQTMEPSLTSRSVVSR